MQKKTYTQLVVQPGIGYPRIEQALVVLNYQRQIFPTEQPPLIPGEPELAAFLSEDGEIRLSYSFNPVVNLRVLSFAGAGGRRASREVADRLPTLGPADLQSLLASDDLRQLLLGIFAATEMETFELLPRLGVLQDHGDPRVAGAAARACRKLAAGLAARGIQQLAREQQRRPDRSALFAHSGRAWERRQVLRWLLRQVERVNAEIVKVLRSALEDEDWETRATAMLVAARLRAVEVGPLIRRLVLPKSSRLGPSREVREALSALRKAALAHLGGEPLPGHAAEDPGSPLDKAALWSHLRLCVAGENVDRHDNLFLLVHALTTPLDEATPPPEQLPPGTVATEQGYRLRRSGLPLCWVPPQPHWLGSDSPDLPRSHPIRLVEPQQGFFISRISLSRDLVVWIGQVEGGGGTRGDGFPDGDRYLCSYDEALRLVRRMGRIEGLPLTLPTADQWEMAARGPDGRRHPWGNGYEGLPEELESPWGVKSLFSPEGQWTSTRSVDGHPIIAGRDKQLRCAAISEDRCAGAQRVVRLVAAI